MDLKYAIFIVIGTLVVVALFYSSTNFVSAETNCYTFGQNYVCIFTSVDPPAKALIWCDEHGQNCTVTWSSKDNVVTPEVKNAIKNAQIANPEMQGTNSDSHDGGIDNKGGIDKGGIDSNTPLAPK